MLAFHWMGGAILNHVLMQIRHKLPPWAIVVDWVTVSFSPEISFPTNHFGCIIFSFCGAGIPGLALMSWGARQCSQKARLVLSLRPPAPSGLDARGRPVSSCLTLGVFAGDGSLIWG